jgi:tRNA (mo5U34)-methyltransferase
MSAKFLDRQPLLDVLHSLRMPQLAERVQLLCQQRFQPQHHGNLTGWNQAWQQLPDVSARFQLDQDAVQVTTNETDRVSLPELRKLLMQFHPWRKGPLELLGIAIDTEWRSNWKWNRLAAHLDFRGKRILDVGGGNGYYGWRMLGAGASIVLGCEPFLLSVAQFEVFRRYWPEAERHWVVPLADVDLPRDIGKFDITFSMGVLYHRPNPIEHLQILLSTLKPGGQLVLETIVHESVGFEVLVPEDRYAKMRNVWFLPSVEMLQRWLRRTGFADIKLIDVSRTTTEEQRRTEWMTFESLADFLDPDDTSQTLEGYPAPTRALMVAQRA